VIYQAYHPPTHTHTHTRVLFLTPPATLPVVSRAVCFCFWFPVSRLIRGMVAEKEAKIREGMRMMGLGDAPLLYSWLLTYALIYLLVAVVIALITKRNIFKASNGFLVFIFFWLFGLSTTTFCYLISVFFSRARTASTIGIVLFLGASLCFARDADASSVAGRQQQTSAIETATSTGKCSTASRHATRHQQACSRNPPRSQVQPPPVAPPLSCACRWLLPLVRCD